MSTSALLIFSNSPYSDLVRNNSTDFATVFVQMDGYPISLGTSIGTMFGETRIVDGLRVGNPEHDVANGMDCFAAQVIASLKDRPGNVYLSFYHNTIQSVIDDPDVSFVYFFSPRLSQSDGRITLLIRNNEGDVVYDGDLSDLTHKDTPLTQ